MPQRTSLVMETVRVLREAIVAGRWAAHLPGERRLCEEWRISRPTLRAALSTLAAEGLIKVAQGRPTEVLAGGVRHEESGAPVLTVGLLSPEPLHAMPPFALLWLDELRGQLAAAGHLLQVHVGRSWFNGRNPARALASLTAAAPAAVWVLYRSTEGMQRWFEEQQVPCVIVGSPFAGIRLPSVDRDYRAVCRHAVGAFLARGHLRLGLIIQEPQFAGDRESEAGFQEGLKAASSAEVSGSLFRHDGTRAGILKTLDTLLRARLRPTALIVARSACALTVCTGLLQRGVRIPQEMAVICRDDDLYLDEVVPSVARYSVPPSVFAKQIFRLVQQPGTKRDTKVMPVFLKRESLQA
ncbi:MAG: substrate-binding domain-containing protein [Prosthecobacter sp.]|nr:substrate-binding domain-containing protein [Prosthecobacter sp.]